MPITSYQLVQGANRPGTWETFNPGEDGLTYNIPPVFQQDTYLVTTGDATPGWSVTVTNTDNLQSYTFTFDPVDAAGAASATTADAARSMAETWNSDPQALLFGRASVSGSTVTITYASDRFTYSLAVTEAGLGAGTVTSPAVAGSRLNLEVGTFAFRPTNAAIAAGADPYSLVTQDGAILEQLAGGIVRRLGNEGPSFDSTLTYEHYRPTDSVPVARRGVLAMPTGTDINVGDPVEAIVAAGSIRFGWVATGAGGLAIPATTAKVYQGAKEGGIAKIEFTIA